MIIRVNNYDVLTIGKKFTLKFSNTEIKTKYHRKYYIQYYNDSTIINYKCTVTKKRKKNSRNKMMARKQFKTKKNYVYKTGM